ncbi:MAG TPA: hypothetical protein GX713_03800 [Mollicutes bacterium]|nr:hypothetical protein [Mollicutes bacterium]
MIEFYKNEEKIELETNNIKFDPLTLIITKEEEDYTIILDFMKKECFMHLNDKNQRFAIEVIHMDYSSEENNWTFNYELTSEEGIKNTIKLSY